MPPSNGRRAYHTARSICDGRRRSTLLTRSNRFLPQTLPLLLQQTLPLLLRGVDVHVLSDVQHSPLSPRRRALLLARAPRARGLARGVALLNEVSEMRLGLRLRLRLRKQEEEEEEQARKTIMTIFLLL